MFLCECASRARTAPLLGRPGCFSPSGLDVDLETYALGEITYSTKGGAPLLCDIRASGSGHECRPESSHGRCWCFRTGSGWCPHGQRTRVCPDFCLAAVLYLYFSKKLCESAHHLQFAISPVFAQFRGSERVHAVVRPSPRSVSRTVRLPRWRLRPREHGPPAPPLATAPTVYAVPMRH